MFPSTPAALVLILFAIEVLSLSPAARDSSSTGCDKGWTRFKNNCYLFIRKYQHFRYAVDTCNSLNALPLMVEGPDVQTFIEDTFLINNVDNDEAQLHRREKQAARSRHVTITPVCVSSVWLGGLRIDRDAKTESFRWINGQKLNYSLWKPGEPSNWTSTPFGMQFCMALDGCKDTMGKWVDVGCHMRFHVICQKMVKGLPTLSGDQAKASTFTFEIKQVTWQIETLKQQATDTTKKRNILLGVNIVLIIIAATMFWVGDFSKKTSLLPNWVGMNRGGVSSSSEGPPRQTHFQNSQPKDNTPSDANGNNVGWVSFS